MSECRSALNSTDGLAGAYVREYGWYAVGSGFVFRHSIVSETVGLEMVLGEQLGCQDINYSSAEA